MRRKASQQQHAGGRGHAARAADTGRL